MIDFRIAVNGKQGTYSLGRFVPGNGDEPIPVRWESNTWPPEFKLVTQPIPAT